MRVKGFDWDLGNTDKCQKHGLSIEEIEQFFRDGKILVAPDPKHSEREERFLAIGKLRSSRHVFIAFTFRNERIRPISARYMHKTEVRKYEEEIAEDEK